MLKFRVVGANAPSLCETARFLYFINAYRN